MTTTGGPVRATVSSAVPGDGSVRITVKPTGAPSMYKLGVSASHLDAMASGGSAVDLRVQIGATVLSQSLTFRTKHAGLLVYP
jgi:hypothetical protein